VAFTDSVTVLTASLLAGAGLPAAGHLQGPLADAAGPHEPDGVAVLAHPEVELDRAARDLALDREIRSVFGRAKDTVVDPLAMTRPRTFAVTEQVPSPAALQVTLSSRVRRSSASATRGTTDRLGIAATRTRAGLPLRYALLSALTVTTPKVRASSVTVSDRLAGFSSVVAIRPSLSAMRAR
jgi:hypothetical protein